MPSAGDIEDGTVEVIGPELIRLDLTKYDSAAFKDEHHVTVVLDLTTARALTIALIQTINKAEVEEVRVNKKRKK